MKIRFMDMVRKHAKALTGMLLVATVWGAHAGSQNNGMPLLNPVNLRADYRVNPLGIDRLPPALSWRMESARPGAAQTAYRIVAASSEKELAAGKFFWDSGKVVSDRSTQIAYAGPLPEAGQRIWWQVRTWDENGNEGGGSQPAWFEAGLLGEAGWQGAQWIGSSQDYKAPVPVPAEWMGSWIAAGDDRPVSRFFVDVNLPDQPVVSAMIYSGANVAGSFPVVNYDQVAPYYRGAMERVGRRADGFVDMATFMLPGKSNRIELRLKNPSAKAVCTAGVHLVFADGTEMKVASGPEWKAGAGNEFGPVKVVAPYGDPNYGTVNRLAQTSLPPSWFRKTVTVRQGLVRARLYCCALGQGLAYLNGKPVDEAFFSSPQSDYEEFAYYTAHDITGLLHAGENALAVLLDGGWYHQVGGFGTVFSYGQPGLKAMVQLEYADGKTERIPSGPDWQWKEGAVREANIYRGEKVDYRLDQDEWKSPDTGAGWQPAQHIPPCSPKTVAVDVNPVRGIREIKPVKSWQTGAQTWLFDIGETTHGVVRLQFNEAAGKTVRLRYSEFCEDGKFMNVPLSHWMCHGVVQHDELIADGKPRTYQSRFTAKSFRFVEVSGLGRPPRPGELLAIPVHTDAETLTAFESSDPMLNRLYQNGIRTFQNYVNHVTGDIPRERCLWGAESVYSIVPATYCFDWAPNHRLMNTLWWTGAMTKDNVPGQIGLGKRLTTMTQSLLWSSTPVFLTSQLAEFYGDPEPMRTFYDKALHFVRFFEQTAEDGIPVPNRLADHAATPDVERVKQDCALINALFFFEIQNRFARMADSMGKTADAGHARAYAETIRAAVMKRYDPAKHTFRNGTHDSLALAYGLISNPDEQKALAASLAGYYRANGHRFDGGFMSYEIYPMLSQFGYVEDAYEMLVNPEYAGPAWSVKTYDATTFYEVYTLDKVQQMKVGQNFFAFGHPTGWMITDLAGIRCTTAEPNGKRMILAPKVPCSGKLGQVTAALKTPMGTVKSAWTYKDEVFTWNFTVPANTSAEVHIPADTADTVTGSESMKKTGTETGAVIYEAVAGIYAVQSRLAHRQTAVPAAIPSGDEKEWRVGKDSKIRVENGVMTVTRGTAATQMLTTNLPLDLGRGATVSFRMKSPATGKGGIRMVSKVAGKSAAQKLEFDLGAPNEWNRHSIPIAAFDGTPASLWIELLSSTEELHVSEITLESGAGVLKRWSF
jgi:alpha-L-rhamnosidase